MPGKFGPRHSRSRESVPSVKTDQLPLDTHAIGWKDANLVVGVRWFQCDGSPAPAKALQGRFLLIHQSDDDVAGIRGISLADERHIAVQDTSLDHRIATYLEREMIAAGHHVGRHVDNMTASLNCLDWRAGRDSPHDGNGNGTPAVVLGC